MNNALEIKDLVKTYPGFKLGPLDLVLEPGMVLGYIGPNSSGKTTTMQCISGLIRYESGEVRIGDQLNDHSDPSWKQDLGHVGDVHVFYENWTGSRNLKFLSQFYPKWSDAKALDLASRLNLPLETKAKNLSTGNRVKLSLVSVLARSPRLLLLDEPTSGLDPVVRTEVLDTLFEILESGESSILYSTHILSDISRLADELAFLDQGKIILRTPIDDLTDRWRKISFQYSGPWKPDIFSVVVHESDGISHQVISADFKRTLSELKQRGVERVEVNRMTVDEIAVQIMKGSGQTKTNVRNFHHANDGDGFAAGTGGGSHV